MLIYFCAIAVCVRPHPDNASKQKIEEQESHTYLKKEQHAMDETSCSASLCSRNIGTNCCLVLRSHLVTDWMV